MRLAVLLCCSAEMSGNGADEVLSTLSLKKTIGSLGSWVRYLSREGRSTYCSLINVKHNCVAPWVLILNSWAQNQKQVLTPPGISPDIRL
jgi:hypothetical protein